MLGLFACSANNFSTWDFAVSHPSTYITGSFLPNFKNASILSTDDADL